MHRWPISLALAWTAAAQTPLPDPPKGSIAGVVSDSGTGAPLTGISVWTTAGKQRIESTTDAQGHYALLDVPLGTYMIDAQARTVRYAGKNFTMATGPRATKRVILRTGNEMASADIQ